MVRCLPVYLDQTMNVKTRGCVPFVSTSPGIYQECNMRKRGRRERSQKEGKERRREGGFVRDTKRVLLD